MQGNGNVAAPLIADSGAAVGPATVDLAEEDIIDPSDGIEIVLGEEIEADAGIVEKNSGELAMVLAEFKGKKLRLGNPVPGLEIRVAEALLDIGRATAAERVRVVRIGALRGVAEQLPEDARTAMRAALEDAFARGASAAIAKTTGEAIEEELSGPLDEILGRAASARLAEIVWQEVTCDALQGNAELPDAVTEVAGKAFHHALRFQIGFALAGMPSHRDAAGAFVELLSEGNLPLGFMRDGTFLVLAA
ncbi:MAG TPA: hypothetical protein VLC10_01905 [Patescibacteria group bacterium]|nr:hypothetical protein [Patescibacteria group bacterium]